MCDELDKLDPNLDIVQKENEKRKTITLKKARMSRKNTFNDFI